MRTIVLCLEGCHGSGKTELCKAFNSFGIEVLDEAFLQMPEYALHPQSLVMEAFWVSHWFQRLLKRHHEISQECKETGEKFRILVADRSPFSAVFYARYKGSLLEDVIRAQIEEMQMNASIDLYTVSVRVDKDLLWSRIQSRLAKHPERLKYNEDSYAWFEETLAFYDNFSWDMFIDNNDEDILVVMKQLLDLLEPRLLRLVSPAELQEHSIAIARNASPVKA
eukprot:ANDGO_00199.mRNA.1 hypothetical protein DICPUDRAFT_27799